MTREDVMKKGVIPQRTRYSAKMRGWPVKIMLSMIENLKYPE